MYTRNPSWRVPVEDPRAHAVIALSFGTRPPNEPDPVNERLAEMCDLISAEMRLPQILQWEIARFCQVNRQHVIHAKEGKYLDTYQCLVEARSFCRDRELSRVIIVAGAFHAYRAQRTAIKLGLNVVGTFSTSETWDPQSQQWWTRGPLLNLTREIPACFYYKLKGWM